jgi:hypothetical protein
MRRTVVVLIMMQLAVGICSNSASAQQNMDNSDDITNSIGFSLLTPAGLNLELERSSGIGTVALAGGYYGSSYGLQLGYTPSPLEFNDRLVRLQMIGGHSVIDFDGLRDEWTYLGAEVVFRPKWLIVAPALTWGTGTFSSPEFALRVGILWRL